MWDKWKHASCAQRCCPSPSFTCTTPWTGMFLRDQNSISICITYTHKNSSFAADFNSTSSVHTHSNYFHTLLLMNVQLSDYIPHTHSSVCVCVCSLYHTPFFFPKLMSSLLKQPHTHTLSISLVPAGVSWFMYFTSHTLMIKTPPLETHTQFINIHGEPMQRWWNHTHSMSVRFSHTLLLYRQQSASKTGFQPGRLGHAVRWAQRRKQSCLVAETLSWCAVNHPITRLLRLEPSMRWSVRLKHQQMVLCFPWLHR